MTFELFTKYCVIKDRNGVEHPIVLQEWQKDLISFIDYCHAHTLSGIYMRGRSSGLNILNKLFEDWKKYKDKTKQ